MGSGKQIPFPVAQAQNTRHPWRLIGAKPGNVLDFCQYRNKKKQRRPTAPAKTST